MVFNDQLHCRLCHRKVKCDKKFHYEMHRRGKKHCAAVQALIPAIEEQNITEFSNNENSWHYTVTKAFIECDIPLYKMNAAPLKKLFQDIERPLPSESRCRNTVKSLFLHNHEAIKTKLAGKNIFIVTDESDVNGQKYVNSLIGLVSEPEKTYLVDCQPIDQSPNAEVMVMIIDDILKECGILRKNVILLLSDAARYMVKAFETIKILYPDCFHVTCFAHLLHNCALRVKAFYVDIDSLIASVKALTTKNKTRKALFKDIGYPPVPIVTRWGSWLEAAKYYAAFLPQVRMIVNSIDDDGILCRRAKESANLESLDTSLREIVECYACLSDLIKSTESSSYSIECAHKDCKRLNFGTDPCYIKGYLDKRLEASDISHIVRMSNKNLSPDVYALLLKCQATSVSVERSFSMLSKILAKDRNFRPDNVKFYLASVYNCKNQKFNRL